MKYLHMLALAGFAAAVAAVTSGDRRVGWIAIVVLLGYLIVRLVQRNHSHAHRNDEPEE